MESAKAAPRAVIVPRPLTKENRLKNGRTTNAENTKEPKGNKKISQMASSVTIYNFLIISSATCSRPFGT